MMFGHKRILGAPKHLRRFGAVPNKRAQHVSCPCWIETHVIISNHLNPGYRVLFVVVRGQDLDSLPIHFWRQKVRSDTRITYFHFVTNFGFWNKAGECLSGALAINGWFTSALFNLRTNCDSHACFGRAAVSIFLAILTLLTLTVKVYDTKGPKVNCRKFDINILSFRFEGVIPRKN